MSCCFLALILIVCLTFFIRLKIPLMMSKIVLAASGVV